MPILQFGIHNVNSENALPFLSYPVNIELNQPIFTYNPYRWDRKIKPLKFSLAKRKYIEDIEQISITTSNHFFTLLQAQVEKKIAATNLSNYDTLYRIAKGRYQLGKIAENDLLQLELNFLQVIREHILAFPGGEQSRSQCSRMLSLPPYPVARTMCLFHQA